jgi:hypothetical protein
MAKQPRINDLLTGFVIGLNGDHVGKDWYGNLPNDHRFNIHIYAVKCKPAKKENRPTFWGIGISATEFDRDYKTVKHMSTIVARYYANTKYGKDYLANHNAVIDRLKQIDPAWKPKHCASYNGSKKDVLAHINLIADSIGGEFENVAF